MRRLLVVTGILITMGLGFGRTTYTGYSGAPGSMGTCASSCHGPGGGTIQIEGFPTSYTPGQAYTLTINHSGGNSISQFNGSCRVGTGSANAGVISAGTNTATYSCGPETNGIHFSSAYQNSGTFTWTAPAAGTGDVRLYVAGQQGSMSGPNSTLVFVSSEQSVVSVRKAPYLLFTGVNTEMLVLWQLTETAGSTIAWGTDLTYSMGSAQTTEYGSDHQHTHRITGLTPGSTYYYRVSTDYEMFTGSFRTAPDDDAMDVKFLAYGSTHTSPANHDMVAQEIVSNFGSDTSYQTLIAFTGDFVADGNSENDWDHQFFGSGYANIQDVITNIPYQAAMGNHEGTGVLYEKYFPYPYEDAHYWSYDYGPVHFVVVDQFTDYGSGSAQHTWLVNDLSASDKLWNILYLNEPGWSAGTHENNLQVQNVIQPLCEQYGVAMVLAGHNQYYSRAVVNDVEHVTTGGGGAPLFNPNPGYPNVVATSMNYHFCAVEIDSNELHFSAIKHDGTVLDSFTKIHGVSNVGDPTAPVITEFALFPAYPNPFNASTVINYRLPAAGEIRLTIHNILGQRIETLFNGMQQAGAYSVIWDASQVGSGVYFTRLQSDKFDKTIKMVLMK